MCTLVNRALLLGCCLWLVACQSPSQSSSSSMPSVPTPSPSSSSSSSSSSSGSSSSSSSASAPSSSGASGGASASLPSSVPTLPSGGTGIPSTLPSTPSMPSPPGQSGGQSASTAGESGAESGGAGNEFPGGGSGGDTTLSDALEAFEKARGSSNAGQGDQAGDAFETEDFPMILTEETPGAGDASESSGSPGEATSGESAAGSQASSESEGGGPAQTTDEQLAVLDDQLQQSYGQFEGMILRERGYVRDRDNARGTDLEPLEGDNAEPSGTGVAGGAGEYREPISGSGSGNRPENPDQREGDFEQVAVVNQVPADIPDGSDDDVVARQLREAAMKEADPELRDKLWEEYRKYKNKGS